MRLLAGDHDQPVAAGAALSFNVTQRLAEIGYS